MKRNAALLVAVSTLTMAPYAFAGEHAPAVIFPAGQSIVSTPAPASVLEPGAAAPAWLAVGGCLGNCVRHCDSGIDENSYVTAGACCDFRFLCSDGSSAWGAEWYPVTCGIGIAC
jgi:hypothetical protein